MRENTTEQDPWIEAAKSISKAERIFLVAGSGMSTDSGLVDFRNESELKPSFPFSMTREFPRLDVNNPCWFEKEPELAWGFYMHQLHLCRQTPPHTGYGILKHWIDSRNGDGFVLTSNMDGHFQQAGFEEIQVCESRGSLRWLQSASNLDIPVWTSDKLDHRVDGFTGQIVGDLPLASDGSIARPNLEMRDDACWNKSRYQIQSEQMQLWLQKNPDKPAVVIEIGVETDHALMRQKCEVISRHLGCPWIRIDSSEDDDSSLAIHLVEKAVVAIAKLHFLIASGQV